MRRRKEVVMALEQVFECPRTLRRLRSGPLAWIPTEADSFNRILSKAIIIGHSARKDVSKL